MREKLHFKVLVLKVSLKSPDTMKVDPTQVRIELLPGLSTSAQWIR
jgi:hypothetical protein